MTKNQIEYQKLLLDREYKQKSLELEEGKLQETKRANRRQEDLTQTRDTLTLGLRDRELGEAVRHNQAVEVETNRSNVARETETTRHNKAAESIDTVKASAAMSQAAASHAQVAELGRHNRVVELQSARQLDQRDVELSQSGTKLTQEQQRIDEARRHNLKLEDIEDFKNDLSQQQLNINKWRARFQNAKDVVGMLDTLIDDLDQFQRTQLLKNYEQVFDLSTGDMAIVRKLFRAKR